MELIGNMYGEGDLIGMDYAYELSTQSRHVPEMIASTRPLPLLIMSIPEINNQLALIGYLAYTNYLKNSKDQMINAEAFSDIVNKVLYEE